MTEDAEIRGVIPNYYAFIMGRLNRIAALEDIDNLTLALDCALKSIKYLPRKLKNQIREEYERIQNRIKNEAQSSGYFSNTINKEIEKAMKRIALEEENNFVNKITTLLDQEHLLTQSYGIPTRSRSMGDIQKTVDQARYDTGE
jgi:Fe2+ transport system protein B